MMPLYKISNEYQAIINEIDSLEGNEIDIACQEKYLSKIDEIHGTVESKIVALASFVKNIEAEKSAIEEARLAMAAREIQLTKKFLYLQSYLKENMEKCGITEISSSPYFTIKLKKCPQSVLIYDEAKITDEYKRRKVVEVLTIDKVKIKEEISNGVIVDGAKVVQNTRLEIK